MGLLDKFVAWVKHEDDDAGSSTPDSGKPGIKRGEPWMAFTKGQVVGKGAYGEAIKCVEKSTKHIYCIKQVDKGSGDGALSKEELDATENEIAILSKLSAQAAPFVVHMHSAYESPKSYFLAMEWLGGGELLDRVQARKHYSEDNAATLMRTMLGAVEFCHEHHIAHRDIKLDNYVFLNEKYIEEGGVLKLIDMGFALNYSANPKITGLAGTYRYMAPEVVNSPTYDEKVDIWSVGAILYCLLCGKFPGFQVPGRKQPINPSDEVRLKQMKDGCELADVDSHGKKTYLAEIHPKTGKPLISAEAKDLIQKLLAWDPTKRLSATEALAHPWMQHGAASADPIDGLYEGKTLLQRLKKMHVSRKLKQQALVLLGTTIDDKSKAELRAKFNELDKDGDGLISAVELQESMLSSGHKALEMEALEKLLSDIDVHHVGGIDFEEFVAANLKDQVLEQEAKLYGVFEQFDVDHTGFLTVSAIKKGLKIKDEKEVQAIIDELDEDHDGKVSYMEFLTLMARHDDSGELRKRLVTRASTSGHLSKKDLETAKADRLGGQAT